MKMVDDEVGIACPICGSSNIHPANKEVIHLPCYVGEIGTVH